MYDEVNEEIIGPFPEWIKLVSERRSTMKRILSTIIAALVAASFVGVIFAAGPAAPTAVTAKKALERKALARKARKARKAQKTQKIQKTQMGRAPAAALHGASSAASLSGNFQSASVVIGQSNFMSSSINQGGSPAANTLQYPYGNPVVANGIFYLPDTINHRVLGFNTVPSANNASADFVLGQPDFTTNSYGDAANELHYPQTIKYYNGKLFVLDSGNNRVLIWNNLPTTTQSPADIVVGQADFGFSEEGAEGASNQTGLWEPESMEVVGGKLIVSDTLNNRVVIWNSIPTVNGAPADLVLGQKDFIHNAANDDDQNGTEDAGPTARTLSSPTGVWSDGTKLLVADSFNNRVLIWTNFPMANFKPADYVIGQSDFIHNAENDDDQDGIEDEAPSARTFDYPYAIFATESQLFVTDFWNNRIVVWNGIPTSNFASANWVLGQPDFTTPVSEIYENEGDGLPIPSPTAQLLYLPGGVYVSDDKLFVADTYANRYLIFDLQ